MGFVAHAFRSAPAFLNSQHLAETSCLISDVRMPDMTGIQLQEALRARGRNIPTILLTAFPDDKARGQALSRGAICFLSKPFKSEALVRCLRSALNSDTAR
jgi:FixJ family two-component response regulator